jgi:hypothetical protein
MWIISLSFPQLLPFPLSLFLPPTPCYQANLPFGHFRLHGPVALELKVLKSTMKGCTTSVNGTWNYLWNNFLESF